MSHSGPMTFTDYLLDIALIAIVVVQIRGRRLTTRSLVLPLGIVGYVAVTYLKGIPTTGNDLVLVAGCTLAGAVLGGLCGLLTSVRPDASGVPVAKAGVAAATLWVLGVGTRFAFQLYATHGGGAAIERFSVAHDITTVSAWTAALILMALAEAVLRTAILGWRGYDLRRKAQGGVALRSSMATTGAIMGSGDASY